MSAKFQFNWKAVWGGVALITLSVAFTFMIAITLELDFSKEENTNITMTVYQNDYDVKKITYNILNGNPTTIVDTKSVDTGQTVRFKYKGEPMILTASGEPLTFADGEPITYVGGE